MEEKLATLAPGRLSLLIAEGLRGHHLLFEPEQIRAAFEGGDLEVASEDAEEVGEALLTICRDPLPVARGSVAELPERARLSLIRLYFRLLDSAGEAQRLVH